MAELIRPFPLDDKCQMCVQSLAVDGIRLSCPAARLSEGSKEVNRVYGAVIAQGRAGDSVANTMVAGALRAGLLRDGESNETKRTLNEMRDGARKCIGPVIMKHGEEGDPFARSAGFHTKQTLVPPESPGASYHGPAEYTTIDVSRLTDDKAYQLLPGGKSGSCDALVLERPYEGDGKLASKISSAPGSIIEAAGKFGQP